ncbi:hypothetical protein DNTS_003662, partial [Danionella cerebrum]
SPSASSLSSVLLRESGSLRLGARGIMSTKAEQFGSKVRYLQEYHNRVLHNIYPVPSGTDIANTLKYFSQTLLSILSRTGRKESQEASDLAVPMTMCLFPVPFPLTPSLRPPVSSMIPPTVTRSLLYSVLRDAPAEREHTREAQLSEYPSLDYQGLYSTLVTLLDLVPLLQHGQHELGQAVFYTTSCLLPFLSEDLLSTLPFTMISTLATFPPFLHKDVIEYLSSSFLPMAILGSRRREGGVPTYVNLSASSMLMIAMQYTSNPVYHCQLLECLMKFKQEVWKDLLYVISYGPSQMCMDPALAVALGDKPPPLYICDECSQRIAGDHPEWLIDNCSSHVRRAVVTCFSAGCCGRHGNRPVRYCKRCHVNHHSSELETHLYQTSPPPINTRECGAEELEAEIHAELRETELNRRRQMGLSSSHHSLDNLEFDNKEGDQHDQRLLSQFGIWFLWFHSTAYMMDDEVGSLVEKLKPQFVTKWLKTVCDVRFDVMVICLLPKPAEFARVGGYWDKTCSSVVQLKEGLNRLLCLIPYNVISQSLWECVMPEWMEALRSEVPAANLREFREVLSKMFDIELCPLPFSMEEMFGFISCRFTGFPASVQEQALLWLHVLSELDIVVPLQLLIGMFSDGVNSLKELATQAQAPTIEPNGNTAERRVSMLSDPGRAARQNPPSPLPSPPRSPFSPFRSLGPVTAHCALDLDCEDEELNLGCFILMFDLVLKQMELQEDALTLDLDSSQSRDVLSIINSVLQAPWGGSHSCRQEQKEEKPAECSLCQSSILCYQLACHLLERLAPPQEIRLVEPSECLEESLVFPRADFSAKPEKKSNEGDEPSESYSSHSISPQTPPSTNSPKWKFSYQELPVSLKLLYTILQEMGRYEEPDILFNMLSCLKILCLHGECLYLARKDHPQFLEFIQETMLIPSLWSMLRSEFCQLASLAVPQLLHALSLGHGADIFWRLVDSSFNNNDWKIRFQAVERVAVLCRFLDIGSVTKSHVLKYSLAHAFCCFLTSIEDVNPAVATRARLLLDSIRRPALQGVCLCLDFQFDAVVRDRPVVLSKLLLLHSLRPEIPALSYEFFINRFETLSLEAQLHLDCNKEFPFPTTITAVRTNVANLSDAALWKIRRARFARNQQQSVRSLRESVRGPAGSKRACSLPETLGNAIPLKLPRQEQSAPILGSMLQKVLTASGSPPSASGPLPALSDQLPEDAGIDQQTVHQLISVLMQFMARDQSSAELDLSSAKAFNTLKRHLHVLLGFEQTMGCFIITPQKMRASTCFNAFIARIAQVMDYNIGLGKQLLPLVVQVLKYCTCPELRPNFQEPPHCSLWALKTHIRQRWLRALLVILYKYPYREMEMSRDVVLHLIHITINTLNAQFHSCRPHVSAGPLYSDNSNISRYSEKEKEEDSVFDESDIHDTPTGAGNKESQTFFARLKRIGGSKSVKYQPVELNAQRSEMELSEYKESGGLQDTLLFSSRDDNKKKRLQAMHKQKSLDIGNTDSMLFNLDERRRKSCIERCEPPASSTSGTARPSLKGKIRGKDSSNGNSVMDRRCSGAKADGTRPVIPEVRLSCMETLEDKPDSPLDQEDPDLIDLSSDCSSIPEKHSILSLSDSDSLVFEPLPPLRIVESNEDLFEALKLPGGVLSKDQQSSGPSTPLVKPQDPIEGSSPLSETQDPPRQSSPVVQISTDNLDPSPVALVVSALDLPDSSAQTESIMTLKQKRDLFRKSSHMLSPSLDEFCDGASLFIGSALHQMESLDQMNSEEDRDEEEERDSEPRADGENDEAEFKIQIVPRQRKERKIAVSAIQREYLDISFNTLDKMREPSPEPDQKSLSSLDKPRESASAPALEAEIPETSHRSSVSTQYRQVKRGSLGAVTMTQLMKRQLEHQSSNNKSSLLSAQSTASMFVPAPEEFSDEQPSTMADRCRDCGAVLEEYDEETLALAVVVLSMFVHLSPDLAAPMLLEIMQSVARLASSSNFSGQAERTLALSLIDFNELSSVAALSQLLEGLNSKKSLPVGGAMLHCLENMSCPLDSSLRVIICLLKIPLANATRSLLEPCSKLLSFVLQYGVFSLSYLIELCGLCYKTFSKERDKFYMSRVVVLELLQALKFKSSIPDTNLLLLVQFVCSDIGSHLAESSILQKQMIAALPSCTTAAMECLRQYLSELLDFISDMHTLTNPGVSKSWNGGTILYKSKKEKTIFALAAALRNRACDFSISFKANHMKACCQPLHEDTFGGNLKVGLAQIVAMEISRGNHRDSKSVTRYLPWLYHPPSAMQQGPKEFIECVSRVRQLSWLLLGSLTHSALLQGSCLPVPLDAGAHIADHLIVILVGFPEQSKTSVLHMCSLFHVFIFSQLWTIYCEQNHTHSHTQTQSDSLLSGLEFWSRVTPSILQLMAHNRMVEMVCLHVISLMEALQESDPHVASNDPVKPKRLQLRLQAIQNRVNNQNPCSSGATLPLTLRKWLQCTQFKMAQVEIQSSEAASQFYPM